MDKLLILQSARRIKIMNTLNADETRLYLILLANSRENGDGKILLRVINGVIGEGFSMDRLKVACLKLAECGLIEVSAPSLKQVKGADSKLAYRITPEKQRAAMLKGENRGAI